MRALVLAFAGVLAVIGGVQLGNGVLIGAKAVVAQWLMERAWDRTEQPGGRVKPWRWADTWPVARLRAPRSDVDLIVLAGMSGRTLAFGQGWLQASSLPGRPGTALIAGHRDTHFAFLQELGRDDLLVLETADGREHWYRVARVGLVDSSRARLALADRTERLVLVTCYPFDNLEPGGPLRWVVEALPVSATPALAA